ncbi:MAG TPA: hypothetical protein VK806_11070 [Bacteroidia bacterium]|jgi:hypothetical protein|nr:hypothetical protein [Bacteroidia bacterium]
MKKYLTTASVVLAFAVGVFATTAFTTISQKNEAKKHPRIEAAIDAMKDAVAYMEKAPDDFGGHKAAAIADTKAAIKSLHQALGYRYKQDEK